MQNNYMATDNRANIGTLKIWKPFSWKLVDWPIFPRLGHSGIDVHFILVRPFSTQRKLFFEEGGVLRFVNPLLWHPIFVFWKPWRSEGTLPFYDVYGFDFFPLESRIILDWCKKSKKNNAKEKVKNETPIDVKKQKMNEFQRMINFQRICFQKIYILCAN